MPETKPAITLQNWLDIAGNHLRHDPKLHQELAKFDTSNLPIVLEARYGTNFGQRMHAKTGNHEVWQREILATEPTYLQVEDSAYGVQTGASSVQFERSRAQMEYDRIIRARGEGTERGDEDSTGGGGAPDPRVAELETKLKSIKDEAAKLLAEPRGPGAPMRQWVAKRAVPWLESLKDR